MYNPYDHEKYPKRKHPRLKGYDYSTTNYYFVTICTHDKQCIFGNPGNHNVFGKIAQEGIEKIPEHHPGVAIEQYVVMPNHVHILIQLQDNKSDLKTVIGSYKSRISRLIRQLQPEICVWQNSFHDHIVRNEKSYQNIWLYIEGNPINWEKDCFYSEK